MRYYKYIFCFGLLMSYVINVYADDPDKTDTADTILDNSNQYVDDRYVNTEKLANARAMFSQQGAEFIVLGEDQLIIIPTDLMFIEQTSVLKWSAYPFLDDLANYLDDLSKVNLRITVYPQDEDGEDQTVDLTEHRARIIANSIWDKGIDTRVMVINSCDDCDSFPFVSGMETDKFKNGRIELSFRELREYT